MSDGTSISSILFAGALLGLIPAYIAWRKGHNFFAWWAGGAALWIVVFPLALLAKTNQAELDRRRLKNGERQCPHCRKFVRVATTVCQYCRRDIRTGNNDQLPLEQLSELKSLLDNGAITLQDFDNLKQKLITEATVTPI
jgi:hypothetical protein